MSEVESLAELQWSHETLIRLIAIIQQNGFLTERLGECVVQLSKGAVLLEGLIQEHLANLRRQKD